MNYIYDIYLNLNKVLYDFYDWNKNDKITHIKKIPIFIIKSSDLNNIITHNIKIDIRFLDKIKNKTETWSIKNKIDYCVLLSDFNDIIAIEFDKDGNSIKKSFLSIDEESEILEEIDTNKIYKINYKILGKSYINLKTRNQIIVDNFVNNELKNISGEKLKYVCIECLGNSKNSVDDLKKINHTSSKYKNLYDILKLTSKGSK